MVRGAMMPGYYLRRQCQTRVRRSHRFLWWRWETYDYEFSPEHVGSYFMGPFPSPEAARRYSLYKPTDKVVPAAELAPELLMLLCECAAQPWDRGGGREVYLTPENIARPLELLNKLRDIWYLDRDWSMVAAAVDRGDYEMARRVVDLIDSIAADGALTIADGGPEHRR